MSSTSPNVMCGLILQTYVEGLSLRSFLNEVAEDLHPRCRFAAVEVERRLGEVVVRMSLAAVFMGCRKDQAIVGPLASTYTVAPPIGSRR